jgi:hypothetical protein
VADPKDKPRTELDGEVWAAVVAATVALSEAIGYLTGDDNSHALVTQLTDARNRLADLIGRA